MLMFVKHLDLPVIICPEKNLSRLNSKKKGTGPQAEPKKREKHCFSFLVRTSAVCQMRHRDKMTEVRLKIICMQER